MQLPESMFLVNGVEAYIGNLYRLASDQGLGFGSDGATGKPGNVRGGVGDVLGKEGG